VVQCCEEQVCSAILLVRPTVVNAWIDRLGHLDRPRSDSSRHCRSAQTTDRGLDCVVIGESEIGVIGTLLYECSGDSS
jgi:hypothetical protein